MTYLPLKIFLAGGERHAFITEWACITVSTLIPIGVMCCAAFCKPRTDLAREQPTSGIFSKRSLVMLGIPCVIYLVTWCVAHAMLRLQPWYTPCDVSQPRSDNGPGLTDWWYQWGDNYD